MKVAAKHNFSKSALTDILMIINAHLPENTPAPSRLRSTYMLKMSAAGGAKNAIEHIFCLSCEQLVKEKPCGKDRCRQGKGYVVFLQLPIANQIIKFFNGSTADGLISRNN